MPLPEDTIQDFKSGAPLRDELSAARLNPIPRRINELSRQVNHLAGAGTPAGRIWEHWLGKVVAPPTGETAATPPRYWVERQQATKALASGDALTLEAEETYGVKKTVKATCKVGGAVKGDEVQVFVEIRQVATPAIHYWFKNREGDFPVNVSMTSGSAGSQSSASSYVYTVTALNGEQLGTGMSPTWARANGRVSAATHGVGYFNTSGAFVLYQVDEVPGTGSCT